MDSSLSDDTAMLVGDFAFEVEVISKANFEHGKTSYYALEKSET